MQAESSSYRLLYLVIIVAVLAFIELGMLHGLNPLDNLLNDKMVRHHALGLNADQDIVIIDIDEASFKGMSDLPGQDRWPWPRSVYAELVYYLTAQQPRAIVFDLNFTEPDSLRPELDRVFAESIQGHDNIFFPMYTVRVTDPTIVEKMNWDKFGDRLGFIPAPQATDKNRHMGITIPIRGLRGDNNLGIIDYVEQDGVGRHYLLYREARGWKIPSLPARVAMSLGYPLPYQDRLLLHWRGDRLAHPRYSFYKIYQDLNSREQQYHDTFRDKIVVIGTTATGLGDLRSTPINSLHPGVEILATAIDNLKNQRHMQPLAPYITTAYTLVLLFVIYWLFIRLASPLSIGAVLAGISVLHLAACYMAVTQLYITRPVTPLLIAWLYYALAALHQYLQERKARERAITMFSRFLDPNVVEGLVGSNTSDTLKSRSLPITVLFSDIRGFTTLSENRSAEDIMSLLNNYFSKQVNVIFHHGGTMDKFIGDAIMAFWGAPLDDSHHALHAVEAALDMADMVDQFREELGEQGRDFDIGIGIHTGDAVVGMVGFEKRMDYTCIGDTVNLASRIEGQTKGLCRVLVSAETRHQCGDAFDFVDHGFYKVKGRAQQVQLLEPRRRSQ